MIYTFYSYYLPAVDFPVVYEVELQYTGESQWMLFVELFPVANVWKRQLNLYIPMQ